MRRPLGLRCDDVISLISNVLPIRSCKQSFVFLFITLLLDACSPVEQPVLERNQQVHLSKTHMFASDGVALPYQIWDVAKPKAVILALHGFNDYSKSFELFADYTKKNRIALFTYDQRGFGKNENLGIWGGDENLSRDVCDALEAVQRQYKTAPIFVMGDSMGAAVALHARRYCDYSNSVKGLILVAPAVWGGNTMNPLFRLALTVLAHTFPEKEFTGEGLEIQASDNREVLRDMYFDPYVIKSTRADAIYGLLRLMDDAHDELEQLTPMRTLILYGMNDEVIPPPSVDDLAEHLPYAVRVDYEQGYHMLLRDKQRQFVYSDIGQWIKDTSHE